MNTETGTAYSQNSNDMSAGHCKSLTVLLDIITRNEGNEFARYLPQEIGSQSGSGFRATDNSAEVQQLQPVVASGMPNMFVGRRSIQTATAFMAILFLADQTASFPALSIPGLRVMVRPAPQLSERSRVAVQCKSERADIFSDGPPGGFNKRDFVALQLIGADVGRQQAKGDTPDDCACIFLAPTLQMDENGVDLKSRLDFTDSTTSSGMQRAVPIPITSEVDRELIACLRGYSVLDSKRVPGRALGILERGQSFIKTRCLYDKLIPLQDQRRAAVQRIQVFRALLSSVYQRDDLTC
jgi:hypothetical protein